MTKLFGLVLAVATVMSAAPAFANPPGDTPPVGAPDASDDDAGYGGDDDYYGGDWAGAPAAGVDVGPDRDRPAARADRMGRGDRGDRAGARSGRERMRAMRQRIKARFDADQDGRLSPSERQAARRAIGLRIHGQRHRQKMQKMFRRLIRKFDRDGDGVVGPGEAPARVIQKLRKFDRNGDGWINAEDFRPQGQGRGRGQR